ncbi:unnamed protein product [Mytilus coruscus]|uniref:Uncharacterized protein n=1 Tax=Mytilus coruscus TaxID=42192 RepID=A0A6J8C4S0_MYTCO|nr:unnamed protein product [Mytilus coruscus]
METDDVKPGFTPLLLEKHAISLLLEYCEELSGKKYLSNALFKQDLLDKTDAHTIHGQFLSDKDGLFDKAICLHCKTWISQASQWISRSINSWPSYHVKQKNNMFENKIEGRAREILLNKLYSLHSYGWQSVLFSDQLSNFHVSMWMDHIEPHTLHTIEVAKTMNSKLLCLTIDMNAVNSRRETYVYKRRIHQIVSCNQSSLKYVYTFYMSLWCAQYTQSIPLNSTRKSNKHLYKQYNSRFCILLQNIYHDAVSGWLMLASFSYKAKQYNKALDILMYSLLKFTPRKTIQLHGYVGYSLPTAETEIIPGENHSSIMENNECRVYEI